MFETPRCVTPKRLTLGVFRVLVSLSLLSARIDSIVCFRDSVATSVTRFHSTSVTIAVVAGIIVVVVVVVVAAAAGVVVVVVVVVVIAVAIAPAPAPAPAQAVAAAAVGLPCSTRFRQT